MNLINKDCIEVMRRAPRGSVDLVLADLPYGTTANKWDSVIPFDDLWECFLRVGKESAAFVLTASQPFTSALVMSNPKLFRHEWIWIKNRGSNFANLKYAPFKEHESVLVFSKGKNSYNPEKQQRTGGGVDRVKDPIKHHTKSPNYNITGTVAHRLLGELRAPSSWQKFNTEVGMHPTQKPVDLMRYMVRTYSNPGETVLDPTMGSGTTGVAAKLEGRKFIGIEQNKEYFDIASKRIAETEAPCHLTTC